MLSTSSLCEHHHRVRIQLYKTNSFGKERTSMGIFVNPDNSAFQVALNSEIYIDKTGLLEYTNKVMNTLQGYICNTHPRRFGKSITANMLTAYLL